MEEMKTYLIHAMGDNGVIIKFRHYAKNIHHAQKIAKQYKHPIMIEEI